MGVRREVTIRVGEAHGSPRARPDGKGAWLGRGRLANRRLPFAYRSTAPPHAATESSTAEYLLRPPPLAPGGARQELRREDRIPQLRCWYLSMPWRRASHAAAGARVCSGQIIHATRALSPSDDGAGSAGRRQCDEAGRSVSQEKRRLEDSDCLDGGWAGDEDVQGRKGAAGRPSMRTVASETG